ncbi:MAG: hypothetical protein JNL77_05480 [Nitrosomonas sp.]|nr:hypothetical protein [Nitrosomonas sp.]
MKLSQEQINELKAKLGLTDFQATELKARLATFSAQADQAADGLLAKITQSKYTWLIVIAIIAAAYVLGRLG